MSETAAANATVWDVGAPGQWALDLTHTPAGCTPIVQHVMVESMPVGMRRVFAELGTPLETLDVRFVNGHFYSRLRPLISPDKPSAKLPPAIVLKIATRVHPQMRRRNATARKVRASEPWNAVIAEWHATGKAEIVARNVALQDVAVTSLTDDQAVAHAVTCLQHCIRQFEHHFWLHGYDLGPLGQYLFEAERWGVPADELLSLLEGASPSTMAPVRAAAEIRAKVEAAGSTPRTLDELRGLSGEIDDAVTGFLRHRSAVLFSRYDIDGVTYGEREDFVLASILTAEVHDPSEAVAARTTAVRERVPLEHRPRFDVILSQARAAMDLRDDNGPNTAEWPLGLLRLALLELGRRLVTTGVLRSADLALELHPDELREGLLAAPPSAEALEARRAARVAQRSLEAPRLIGPDEAAPPLEVLPTDLAHLVGMVQTVVKYMGMDGADAPSGLHGSGIGSVAVRGTARVASTPEEALDLLEPGDILVVHGTTPAYNLVLSLAGGVVTAEGGPMSHAAVIARELGIPAVVGARSALLEIVSGSTVEVDPVAGEVRLLSSV